MLLSTDHAQGGGAVANVCNVQSLRCTWPAAVLLRFVHLPLELLGCGRSEDRAEVMDITFVTAAWKQARIAMLLCSLVLLSEQLQNGCPGTLADNKAAKLPNGGQK